MANRRQSIPVAVRIQVLTEAGYRCAVPTCRGILALDLHHLVEVAEAGGHTVDNLLPLCPTCHALYTRGEIHRDSIYAWKAMLVALGRAFDRHAIDTLLFLDMADDKTGPILSGDGIMGNAGLIVARLVELHYQGENKRPWECADASRTALRTIRPADTRYGYGLRLTPVGQRLVDAWKRGDRQALTSALGPIASDS